MMELQLVISMLVKRFRVDLSGVIEGSDYLLI